MASKNPTVEKGKPLPKRLQPALKALEKDLLERARIPSVEAGLRAAWEAEKKAGETGQGFDPWRRARVTQIAVAWVLSVVFVRTLEDRGLIDPRIAGPDERRLASARDREATFVQVTPFLGPREYLLAVFRELAHLPGAREVFDARHNPIWVLAPSSEGARALLDFFQQVDGATGAPVFTFLGAETRFLGDLYQDLSEAVRKRYALLQTPDFVEKFILEQTLAPAIEEFGLAEVKVIDPTCGSGHFLLGAFRDLVAAWQAKEPTTPIEELARRALDQVYGVDINPYAVAIARFRLVLAVLDAVGITRLDKAPALRPHVVVADSLLHRLKAQQLRLSGQLSMDEWASWGDALFRLAEPGAVAHVLGQRYHAVVGNPPYIVESDAQKKARYRDMYKSASGKFALAAPFTERLFELAIHGGFVGLINANSWTKRDFGIALIQEVLTKLDVQEVIDTAGCYLPGHGTSTLLMFGRNRPSLRHGFRAVLGKRGENTEPSVPSEAPVWSEIVSHHAEDGFEGQFVSVTRFTEVDARTHPWVLAGGGARELLAEVRTTAALRLGRILVFIGRTTHTGDDSFFTVAHLRTKRLREQGIRTVQFVRGQDLDDYLIAAKDDSLFPYASSGEESALTSAEAMWYWPYRQELRARRDFGQVIEERGLPWHAHSMFFPARFRAKPVIGFAFQSTHNQFVISSGGRVFNRTAPAMALSSGHTGDDHRALLGYLNSSLVGFWSRLVMFPRGGDQVGDGARLSATQWNRNLEYAGNLLQQLPVPDLDVLSEHLLDLVVAAEETVQAMAEHGADKVVAATLAETPSLAALRDARTRSLAERARLRGILISLQEEMDWRVYGIFGLPTVTAPSVDAVRVPVEPNHRPFEVRLAREVGSDISASEWFRVHKRAAPADVGGPLADLYRQRLRLLDDPERGRQLRLLETPETKRRWSPPDDAKAFREAVRTWLLERIEAVFREQPTPELRTARQLALDLGRDAAVQAAYELLTEDSGADLVKLVSDLVDAEGVPFLAGFRYAETGMEKRAAWEETWRLQRLEDDGKLEPELKRLGLKAIPVPDKYANKDFLRHYWGLRGKLDVPKERFVTVPAGNNEDDPTPLCGWAGWDHLQMAQALAALYQRRKTEDGWTGERLVPLLAGLAERVPWLLQWHNEPSDAFGGMKLGEFFRDFVAGEAHGLGVAVDFTKATDDLRTWTPPAAPKKKTLDPDELYAALVRWTPEVDEDAEEDEDAEPPEGPTVEELASEAGATKALVNKALKVLLADGRVEKLDGRPARYMATGDDA
ncbi:BREX-2 system adenine-specific DNA-methyltransferase PglX [Myxococcota bacterium]|nr:BREX-2 system adenine-specific DNA-methyltransferase PglX [Myxococcota bacterium]